MEASLEPPGAFSVPHGFTFHERRAHGPWHLRRDEVRNQWRSMGPPRAPRIGRVSQPQAFEIACARSLRSHPKCSPFRALYVFMTVPTASTEEVHMNIHSTIGQKMLCTAAAADIHALLS